MASCNLGHVLEVLIESEASVKCDELQKYLEDLGFKVRDGKKQGHKIVTHPGLENFYSTSYTCGHGRNPEIKPQYIKNIRKTLLQHKEELKAYLKE
jgi:hypothetical protein